MSSVEVPAESLLDAAYDVLGFSEGALLDAALVPAEGGSSEWLEMGGWLSLAAEVGVEKVFFVDNNPVVVFARQDTDDPARLSALYNRVWNMARPELLFVASPGLLEVYDLTCSPARPGESARDGNRRLHWAHSVLEVQQALQSYSREQLESGRSFEDSSFGPSVSRADAALIRDLKAVRRELIDAGLKVEYAHALIGRSIFIRYLEDRQVLLKEYFEGVAGDSPARRQILDKPLAQPWFHPNEQKALYLRVLGDKDFTYALFEKLAADFNGDTFPSDPEEKQAVTQSHLALLRGLLLGDPTLSSRLFFFAYQFDIIPIELISSIYEEFYNTEVGKGSNGGSHYTPGALVEFLLSQVLTPDVLDRSPRILDPACGSGIFMVEAFRRIVRYELAKQGAERLDRNELLRILRNQISGVEINREAVRVAAFSLYLAFLHYQQPRDIRQHKRLPTLVCREDASPESENSLSILLCANSFLVPETAAARFGSQCADVVIGNPPWGYPLAEDAPGRAAARVAVNWCKTNDRPLGDNELSQAFIHRTLDFLKDGGVAGLLVSTGVLFKRHPNSRAFRKTWLESVSLRQVINFAHVRDVFFSGSKRSAEAIAPFVSVVFAKDRASRPSGVFEYWSAKKTRLVESLSAVVLSRSDLKMVEQEAFLRDDRLWTVYWWGNHRDAALIQFLAMHTPLAEHPDLLEGKPGSGLKEGGGTPEHVEWLGDLCELPIQALGRYGPFDRDRCRPAPREVARSRDRRLYEGLRLLVKRGPSQRAGSNGRIVARLDSEAYCFRHSVYAFPLHAEDERRAQILLGILWSSLARYYLFLTASSWGTWHDSISLQELKEFPVHFPEGQGVADEIVRIVSELRSVDASAQIRCDTHPATSGGVLVGLGSDLSAHDTHAPGSRIKELEDELDRLIYQAYGLSSAQVELIQDMCGVGLDLLYRDVSSKAVAALDPCRPSSRCGTLSDLPREPADQEGLEGYLRVLVQIWQHQVGPQNPLWWRVLCGRRSNSMLAVVLSTEPIGSTDSSPGASEEKVWAGLLQRLAAASVRPFGSRSIYLDGLARVVTDTEIMIVKRNENRLWTRSAAREDAEATVLQAIRLRDPRPHE